MSFQFNWPEFDVEFIEEVKNSLTTILNEGDQPLTIADRIVVTDLSFGHQVGGMGEGEKRVEEEEEGSVRGEEGLERSCGRPTCSQSGKEWERVEGDERRWRRWKGMRGRGERDGGKRGERR